MPIQTSAFAQLGSEVEAQEVQPNNTRQITQTFVYPASKMVPLTYKYNKHGWSGTLKLKSSTTDGKTQTVVYKGTISCSGTCPIPSQEGEEK